MTNAEAIKTLRLAQAEVEWEYPMDIAAAIDVAVEALEKAEKYRWHDLRKNPEDLPVLPEDDNAWFEVVQENCETYPRQFAKYCEGRGFGYYADRYDPDTLGFVDSEFKTLEEDGQESVIAWRRFEPFEEENDD